MTSLITTLKKYDPFLLGFDGLFNQMKQFDQSGNSTTGYPPYNIIRNGEDSYTIELAIAGFTQDDITVMHEPEKNRLVIEGSNQNETQNYVHQGIASRKFSRSWTVSDHIVIKSATINNGILKVELENVLPEEQKTKVIEVKTV